MSKKKIIEKFKEYHFQFKHLTVIFIVLFVFQIIISFINKSSIQSFFNSTQNWYQKDSAERLANLTSTTFELLLETINNKNYIDSEEQNRITKAFDIIFSQEVLQHNIEEMCIFIEKKNKFYVINDGKTLFKVLYIDSTSNVASPDNFSQAVSLYRNVHKFLISNEQIRSIITNSRTFNTFVPLVLRGEYIGAVYMRNTPDLSFISSQIMMNYDETSVLYLALISLGLLSMYFVSSYTVKERDEAQKLLFEEHEKNIKKQITFEKELAFTKRIYHTHHKAEKIVGFIKGDLKLLSPENINTVKFRVSKYANFISRIIYDMKWYEPPVQAIRNPNFKTNINEVMKFIVEHIFLRSFKKSSLFNIKLELDDILPLVQVNEFVVWEIIEPLIQNSIDHAGIPKIEINIKTIYDDNCKKSKIIISDNGFGISAGLMEINTKGFKKIFEENISTKKAEMRNTGYGCYLAHEFCTRCGWKLDVDNLPGNSGCAFTITINN